MSYQATAYKVMIASPSDIVAERGLIRDIIHEWNAVHSEDKRIVLLPVGWDTHSSPAMGERPQGIINKQVLRGCDLLIAVFWTRLGSPTDRAPSGTVEEINEHLAAGKPAMIYFSMAPVRPDSVDDKQYSALRDFREQCFQNGLCETYETISEFREKLSRQLAMTVIRDDGSGRDSHGGWDDDLGDASSAAPVPGIQVASRGVKDNASRSPKLSELAARTLIEASQDETGMLLKLDHLGGTSIQTNGKVLFDGASGREVARWEAAIDELLSLDLIARQGADDIYRVTATGYEVADNLKLRT